jgi:hypothetical protein
MSTTPAFHSTREAPNLLVVETTGQMDAVAMEIALNVLVDQMDGMHHGGILMRANDVEWPTLGAIAVELRHWVQLMAAIKKVDKVALISDQDWIRRAASVESALIPNLVIKSFDPGAEAAARDWLALPLSADATA